MSASIESGVAILHAVGEDFVFLKKTLQVSPAYSKEHGRDRDNKILENGLNTLQQRAPEQDPPLTGTTARNRDIRTGYAGYKSHLFE